MKSLGRGRGRWATGEEIQVMPEEYGDDGFSPETLLKIMDHNNVSRAVLLQGSLYGFQNEYTAEAVNKYPHRFIGAGTLDPFCTEAERILDHLTHGLGCRILKFELSSHGGLMGYHETFKIDGPEMEMVWQTAAARDMVVVLDIGRPGSPSFQVNGILEVIKKHPGLRLVLAHLLAPLAGDHESWLSAIQALRRENIWFDITALPWNIREPYPYSTSVAHLAEARKILGADRLIWGSDAPILLTLALYEQLISYVTESGVFTDLELAAVMAGNAAAVYGL